MHEFLLPFLVSLALTLLIVRSAGLHGRLTADRDFDKPQGMHVVPTPRIGGLGIVVAMWLLVGTLWLAGEGADAGDLALLLACALPAFLAGFVQDFTEAVTPRGRLLATAISAALAFYVCNAAIHHTTIPGLDRLVLTTAGSLLLTVFAVAGIAHAANIIDGLNGLASMCVMLMLGATAYVAFQVQDELVLTLALAGIGAVLGFFVWNFPAGLIFLGDGGAYFLGFWVAEVNILLIARNPQVSPLFPLLVCIYPAFETVFSMYRRLLLRSRPAHLPDGIHLHTLVYRRVMRWALGEHRGGRAETRRNSMTSPVLWMLCMASLVPATLWWTSTPLMASSLLIFVGGYIVLYWRIVRFKAPRVLRWMRTRPTLRGSARTRRGDNRPR